VIRATGGAAGAAMTALALLVLAAGIATVGARAAGYSAFIVTGGSMEPTISLGSIILVRPVSPEEIRVADVVTMRRSTGAITHRVMAIERGPDGREFTLQGDANAVPDVDRIAFVDRAGLVVASVPYAGYIAAYARAYWRSALGLAGAGLLFGAAVVLLHDLRRPRKAAAATRRLIDRAGALARTGRRSEAVAALRQACELAPQDLLPHRRLTAMLLNDGEVVAAMAEHARFDRAIRASEDGARADLERAYFRAMLRSSEVPGSHLTLPVAAAA
jgi:signal peptidase